MSNSSGGICRRTFLAGTAAATAACLAGSHGARAGGQNRYTICAFVKFLQSLPFDQLAETIAEMGFQGIEATVRRGGQVLPERVEEDLPKLVEALAKCNLQITVMATNVNRADDPLSQRVLKTAASLGVRRYRMEQYRYDHQRSVIDQLNELRPVVKELADLNRQLGISAVYQNHSGARYVGAVVWDVYQLIKDLPVDQVGIAFDIRHATVEGGLSWPTHFNLVRPHLAAVYVKDFVWEGRKPKNVPLGEGQVDPAFFQLLRKTDFTGPVSLHVEYLQKAGVKENAAALARDLKTLRKLLAG